MKILLPMRAALIAALFFAVPTPSPAQFYAGIGISIAPPAIPIYTQPPCPAPNYLWTPGYWAWGPGGYYWVPGTWVLAPTLGYFWTPGYWGWSSNAYFWHRGYWGPTVGFYGGINYGFGYFGTGFVGGRWIGRNFTYNTAITNVNRTVIHNTYRDVTVINQNNHVRTSYNGGRGGIQARPTSYEAASRNQGRAPTTEQKYHEQTAGTDRNHLATVNHGYPRTTAVSHPYSATNRPPHYTPVTSSDRQAAQQHVAVPGSGSRPQGNRPPQGNHPPQ
ncbi:MAG: YXWGXW repeat-containing protein [Candidatus Cybelea sp.]|jgi:WXXGXW repeat (2 copies)